MTFQVESPKITEIQVRMDCNGCVQKIRRALQSVQGIYKAHEDFSQQKIIVIGWADPKILMKAIKRAGKIAKLCSHTDVEQPKTETPPAEAAPAPETPATETPPAEAPPAEAPPAEAPPAETKPPEEPPPPPPPAEAPPAEAPPPEAPPADPKPQENPENPSPPAQEGAAASETAPPVASETSYYINSYPNYPRYEYVVRDGYYGYHMGTQEYMMRYNSPEYVDRQRRYQRDPYYYTNNNGRSNDGFSTVFSDENPNACCIA